MNDGLYGRYRDANRSGIVGRENTRGVTAIASAPEVLVQMVIDRLRECGAKSVQTLEGVNEHVIFRLPRGLSKLQIAENSSQPNA